MRGREKEKEGVRTRKGRKKDRLRRWGGGEMGWKGREGSERGWKRDGPPATSLTGRTLPLHAAFL